MREQGVPPALEWDGRDGEALHLLAENDVGQAIGTGRLLPDGHIGRLAVSAHWRNRGIGAALLRELVAIARERGAGTLFLHAQTRAVEFYRRGGFVAEGPEFMEAGIPHQRMVLAP